MRTVVVGTVIYALEALLLVLLMVGAQGLRRLVRWTGRTLQRPLVTIVGGFLGGVYLIGLPTYYSLYPDPNGVTPRALLLAGWIGFALLLTIATVVRDDRINRYLLEREEEDQRERLDLRMTILQELLRPGTRGVSESYTWQTHRYDGHALQPLYPQHAGAEWVFRPGQGVVGLAFARGDFAIAVGPEAANAPELQLTAAQSAAFGHLQAIMAIPLRNGNQIIGVLSAATQEADGYFQTVAGEAVARQLAELVAAVLNRV